MGNRNGANARNSGKDRSSTPKKRKLKYVLRVLTLGISGSGKTTFAKQMKIITLGGFAEDEKQTHKEILLQNILIGIQELVKQAEKLEYPVEGENRKHCRFFTQLRVIETEWNEKIGEKVKVLWNDQAIQKTWKAAPGYQLQMVHIDYLMENLERISKPEYIPSNEDMLRARQRTTGEQTTSFIIDKNGWDLIDVGGQKPERVKWESIITSKESVNAIIFFAALDEFNMISAEEPNKTKMEVSMQVFQDVLHTEAVFQRPYITLLLFLNKIDLLESKLKNEEDRKKFQELFPDYNGVEGLEGLNSACESVRNQFTAPFKDSGHQIHTHYICALNTTLMEDVFKAVRQTIFDNRLSCSGVKV